MITRNAIYSFIENLIETSAPDDALYEAISFRTLRASVDEAVKVVRVDCVTGTHNVLSVDGNRKRERNVQTTIQCFMTPDVNLEPDVAMEEATDVSFAMSQQIFDAMAISPSLNGTVCDAYFEDFETGEANLGATRRGVTYLDGTINRI